MKNLRQKFDPPKKHADFKWTRGSPSIEAYDGHTKVNRIMRSRFRSGYYHFGVCFWGSIGKIVEIGDTLSGNYYLIHDHGEAREVFEQIEWNKYLEESYCVGAPQCTPEMLIEIYEGEKWKLIHQES